MFHGISAFRLFWQRLLARLRYCGGAHYLAGAPSLPPPLTPEQEKALLARMAAGEADARDALILHNLRLVVYIARRFENTGVNLEDLISIGTIGLIASRDAREVISVELNPDAVRDAVTNAKRNQIKNVSFYQNDAGAFMVSMAEKGEKADVVFMDPPRAGSDEAFLSSVVTLSPKKVVYVSCNPETLARDLRYLTKHGYKAEEAWGYDMFAWSEHVETVCLLTQKKA